MNVIVLLGRIGNDLELKDTQNGGHFVSFNLAVDKNYQKSGAEKVTYWHRCVAYDRNAENIAKFFHKGDKICVSGELQSNEYTDRDGNRRESKQVVVGTWDFCESSRNDIRPAPRQSEWQQAPIDEDLPFN